jgi:hypothetical protein
MPWSALLSLVGAALFLSLLGEFGCHRRTIYADRTL